MLSTIQEEDRAEEKKAIEEYLISLKIVLPDYQEGWTLDHDSNTTWLSSDFHRYHNTYATVVIAPSTEDSAAISSKLEQDNLRRQRLVNQGQGDPGRDKGVDWFEDTEGKYELVVIHPSHFLIDNFPLVIKHPLTKQFKPFYANERGDGTLREGSPTGPILPPFYSRGKIHREIPLNPILVNWAAMIRFRRLIRQNPMWGSALHPSAVRVLRGVVELHAAVLWDPPRSCSRQFIINPAGSNLSYDLQAWPYFLTSPWSNLGIKTNIPSTALERAFEMLEEGFEELPDLDGDDSHHHPDLPLELGVMMPQEKMERFLTAL